MEKTYDFTACRLCPRVCGANRLQGAGFCGAGDKMQIARAALHFWEEPCISGAEGSGTIFFSGCTLGCVFCQNGEISRRKSQKPLLGKVVSKEELQKIAFSLKAQGANNINLVTPCHFAPLVRAALLPIKEQLNIPIVVNTGGYDSPRQLSFFEGLADIYLPDFKFLWAQSAKDYAHAPDYPQVCLAAIVEMVRQVGAPRFDERGMLQRGVIVRHLILPGKRKESMEILRTLRAQFGPDDLLLSLMSQYAPMPGVPKELDRKITTFEYQSVMRLAEELSFAGYFQDRASASTDYIPPFDLTGT